MPYERGDEADQLARPRAVRAVEQGLGGAECRRDVSATPCVGDREDRRLGASDRELLDVHACDLLAVGPGRELLDLGGEIADVVSDGLDERTAGVTVGGRAEARELLGDPLGQLLFRDVVEEEVAGFRDCLGEGGVPLDPIAEEGEDSGRRWSCEIRLELLHVHRLPGLHAVDHHQSRVAAEQTERVAGGDRVLS